MSTVFPNFVPSNIPFFSLFFLLGVQMALHYRKRPRTAFRDSPRGARREEREHGGRSMEEREWRERWRLRRRGESHLTGMNRVDPLSMAIVFSFSLTFFLLFLPDPLFLRALSLSFLRADYD